MVKIFCNGKKRTTYLHLFTKSTFKKRQIYAKNIFIYIFRIKDTVWAYFLKNDIIQLCIFPYKTCN